MPDETADLLAKLKRLIRVGEELLNDNQPVPPELSEKIRDAIEVLGLERDTGTDKPPLKEGK